MSATANVLEAMTASIMAAKAGKATQLTPVGPEQPTSPWPPDLEPAALFPNRPGEAVEIALYAIRKEVRHLTDALDAIAAVNGTSPVTLSTAEVAKVTQSVTLAKERAADARQQEFEAGLKAKADAAKASVFVGAETLDDDGQETYDDPPQAQAFDRDDSAPPPKTDWQCSTHGRKSIIVETSRKGRVYGLCNLCKEFEK